MNYPNGIDRGIVLSAVGLNKKGKYEVLDMEVVSTDREITGYEASTIHKAIYKPDSLQPQQLDLLSFPFKIKTLLM